eukprot:5610501-Pyramimonas_sp.AAC.1
MSTLSIFQTISRLHFGKLTDDEEEEEEDGKVVAGGDATVYGGSERMGRGKGLRREGREMN